MKIKVFLLEWKVKQFTYMLTKKENSGPEGKYIHMCVCALGVGQRFLQNINTSAKKIKTFLLFTAV